MCMFVSNGGFLAHCERSLTSVGKGRNNSLVVSVFSQRAHALFRHDRLTYTTATPGLSGLSESLPTAVGRLNARSIVMRMHRGLAISQFSRPPLRTIRSQIRCSLVIGSDDALALGETVSDISLQMNMTARPSFIGNLSCDFI
jgi:hypothetical protein